MTQRLPIIAFALVMAAIPFIPGMPPFWIVLLDNIGLAALVAMGLVLLTGVGGLTSFGQAAFCGFGAYTTAVLTTAYGVSPWLTLPASLLVIDHLEHRLEELFLRSEVIVDGGQVGPGVAADVAHRHPRKALLGKEPRGAV